MLIKQSFIYYFILIFIVYKNIQRQKLYKNIVFFKNQLKTQIEKLVENLIYNKLIFANKKIENTNKYINLAI